MLAVRYELLIAYIRKEIWCLLEINKTRKVLKEGREGGKGWAETIYVVHDRNMIVTTTDNTRYRYRLLHYVD